MLCCGVLCCAVLCCAVIPCCLLCSAQVILHCSAFHNMTLILPCCAVLCCAVLACTFMADLPSSRHHTVNQPSLIHSSRTRICSLVSLQALFPDAAATASYVDALAVVEFVNTFGRLWETPPISLSDLQLALHHPQDYPQLGELYHVLLSCVLLDQVTSSAL